MQDMSLTKLVVGSVHHPVADVARTVRACTAIPGNRSVNGHHVHERLFHLTENVGTTP